MTKKFKTLVGLQPGKIFSPFYFIFTGDSMKRIIGHTCAASAKVVCQMQLM
jgi:hypothetical protein